MVHGKRRGNWQFQIDGVDPEAEDITFSKGGFQEGHGGGIGAQPFFIEGVREALDAKGEWWVDVSRSLLTSLGCVLLKMAAGLHCSMKREPAITVRTGGHRHHLPHPQRH